MISKSLFQTVRYAERQLKDHRNQMWVYPIVLGSMVCVDMDLHEIKKGLWYLHIICTFAKFSVAVPVRSKKLKLLLICF